MKHVSSDKGAPRRLCIGTEDRTGTRIVVGRSLSRLLWERRAHGTNDEMKIRDFISEAKSHSEADAFLQL